MSKGFGFAGFSLGQAKKPMVKAFSEEDDDDDDDDQDNPIDGEAVKDPEPAAAKQVFFLTYVLCDLTNLHLKG
jgi:hypothetical protein